MPAIGIFRGPQHIFEYANDELVEILGDPSRYLDRPLDEAFPQPENHARHALIRRAYATGETVYAEMAAGALWIIPLREGQHVVGVATHFVARLRPLPALWPAEPDPIALAG